MASKECFHFTKLDRMYSIKANGLQCRLESNSKAIGDTKSKISYSDTKIGAIGLFSNFYEVYSDYKTGKRLPREDKPGEILMYNEIMKSSSLEEFLGDGVYLLFDGTEINNEGGSTGHGGIYDASTTNSIDANQLTVGLIRNNDTKHVSYSMYDYIHYLMASMTDEEYSQMDPSMQKRYDKYYETHKEIIDTFKKGNYSKKEVDLDTFCRLCKDDINKSMQHTKKIEDEIER